MRLLWLLALTLVVAAMHSARGASIIFSEIMYHPASEDPREEFVEFYNRGTRPVNLAGWQLRGGVGFTFPDVTLLPGEFIVVAADVFTFNRLHPTVSRVVGGWEGGLSNTDEDLNLDTAAGKREDSVHYADEGDWAQRSLGEWSFGHRGWVWRAEHDGGGRTLELINPEVSNKRGQNWGTSAQAAGTPGLRNSIYSTNIPPFILDVVHFPAVPKSTQPVTITAHLDDDLSAAITAWLYYRLDGATAFIQVPMRDDGATGDGMANDSYFGAVLPPQPNNSIVEFYLEARDASGQARTWPAAVYPSNTQAANLLYQVRDSESTGTHPLYLLIMKEVDRLELEKLGGKEPDAYSDAQMNGTFISIDELGVRVQYQVGIRNRGHGSRTARPNNFHVNFPSDQRWRQLQSINLNSQYPHLQYLGSALFKKAGLPAADVRLVRLRVNNNDLASSGSPQYGHYAAVEVMNSDYARNQFPEDSAGNIYRGVATDLPAPAEADLKHRGTDPNAYRLNYLKKTNESEEDWSDLIELTRVLQHTPAETFISEVTRVTDLHEWLRCFAMNALVDNNESGISGGYGDDFGLYRGRNDPRFLLLPHDLDTILGSGAEPGSAQASFFRAADLSVVERLLKGPFLPLYTGHLRGLAASVFAPERFDPLCDELLGGVVPGNVIAQLKTFAVQRRAHLRASLPALIPLEKTWKFNVGGADLGVAWRATDFDDSAWASGRGLLGNVAAVVGNAATRIPSPEGKTTYYFRTKWTFRPELAALRSGVKLEVSTVVDDGAVIYLNGKEVLRLGMAGGEVSARTAAARRIDRADWEGPFVISADNLVPGENVIAVELHQSDPFSSDAVFGLMLDLNSPPAGDRKSPIMINEVMANNLSLPESDGSYPDWVEFYNQAETDLDLHDFSLTDNESLPRKWVFREGTIIPGRGYLIVRFDQRAPTTRDNTGFGLAKNGDQVLLFDRTDRGSGLIDSVQFGLQPGGFTIGRHPQGTTNWVLTLPTPGLLNVPTAMGSRSSLRINEWMADPALGSDWFEVFNADIAPVALGGLFLSDNLSTRTQYEIPPLSFIGVGASAYQRFEADSDPNQGPHHTSFKLNAAGESLAIFSPAGETIDAITFGFQPANAAEGRLPDGTANIVQLPEPSPAERNYIALRIGIRRSGTSTSVWFSGYGGESYTVQFSETGPAGPWRKLRDVELAANGLVEVEDRPSAGRDRFYRLTTPAVRE